MRRISSGVCVALIMSLLLGSARPQAQQSPSIPLNFTGMTAGQQVEFALHAGNIGKSGTATANAQGTAASVLDFANQPKTHTQVDVYQFTCPTPPSPARVVVKMVPHGDPAPDDPCRNRKMVGAFWLDRARGITINVATGTMDVNEGTQIVKWGLIAGGVAGVIAVIAAAGGDDSSTPATTPTTPTSSSTSSSTTTASTTTTTTTASQTPFSSLNGIYAKVASRVSNNCNFFVPAFTGTLTISGVNDAGVGTLVEAHPTQTFTYTVTFVRSGSGFTFTTNSITSNVGGTNFTSNIDGTFGSISLGNGTERFVRISPACTDTFQETYTRSSSSGN